MAYNTSKGPRGLGDIKNEDDVDTQIDWDNDKITFRTNDVARVVINNDQLSGSGDLDIVGATTLGSTLAVSGSTTLGDAAADVATVTAQLTASQGGYFADRLGIGTSAPIGLFHVEKATSPYIYLTRVDSSITEGQDLGGVNFGGTENGTDYDTNSVAIIAEAAGSWDVADTDTPGRMHLCTTPAGSSGNIPRLSIMEDGLVSGSGTFHNVGASTFGSTLGVSGSVTLGDVAADVTTVTGQLTASQGARFTERVGIGTGSPTHKLDINSNSIRLRTAKTPLTAGDTGATGQICWDANYVYVCIAANTWRRIAHDTW